MRLPTRECVRMCARVLCACVRACAVGVVAAIWLCNVDAVTWFTCLFDWHLLLLIRIEISYGIQAQMMRGPSKIVRDVCLVVGVSEQGDHHQFQEMRGLVEDQRGPGVEGELTTWWGNEDDADDVSDIRWENNVDSRQITITGNFFQKVPVERIEIESVWWQT